MTLTEALTQLRAWCDRSMGEPIVIAPGITGSFQSRGTYSEAAVRQAEAELGFKLPRAYYEFMAVGGESSLFGWSPAGGHWYFYQPPQPLLQTRAAAACRLAGIHTPLGGPGSFAER